MVLLCPLAMMFPADMVTFALLMRAKSDDRQNLPPLPSFWIDQQQLDFSSSSAPRISAFLI